MWTRRRTRERELSAELESHLEMHIADNIRAGMTPEEARRQALIALGGVEQTKERYRERRRLRALDELVRDIVFALRLLARDRGFTITAAVVLGVGLAVTNTFFILTNAIVIRGLPIDDPDRVLIMRVRDAADRNLGMSYQDFRDVRAGAKSFASVGAFTSAPMTLGDASHAAERFAGAYVSAEVFGLFGETPIAGRSFQPQDDEPGAPAVVILGRSVWESRYAGHAEVVGSTVRVNGAPATIVGVIPDRSRFPTNTEVWQPLGSMAGIAQQARGVRTLVTIGRLAPGMSPSDAEGELQSMWASLGKQYPATNSNLRLTVRPINEHYNGPRTHPAWIALNAAGLLVLLVACANVANLLVMRGASRSREMAVRTSMGATRARIVRQLLAESAVLAALGGVVAFLLSSGAATLLWIATPEGMLPHWMRFAMDPPMFALLAVVCLGSSVLFGLVPAFQLSGTNPQGALKTGVRGAGSVPSRRLTTALLVAQFAVALGSLLSISAAIRSLNDESSDPKIDMRGLMTMSVALPGKTYSTPASRGEFYERVRQTFTNVNRVSSVALASNAPFGGGPTRALLLEGRDGSSGPRPSARTISISSGYFETLNVSLLQGREFTDQDGATDHGNVIVNQRFVALHFPHGEPIGKQIAFVNDSADGSPDRFTIVGVSPSIRQDPQPEPEAVVYFPYRAAAPPQMTVMVRSAADHSATASALRAAMQSLDADIPLYRLMTLEQAIHDVTWNGRFSSIIANVTGVLAVLLSAIGLYALTAHAVTCMTPEIGIRAALGALPRQVLWRVLRGAAVQLLMGIVAGVAFSFAWDRLLGGANSPPGVGPIDFVAAALLLAVVSAIACLFPAIRALRVNPIVALRYE
jgi:putative ABC transport system permease protein